MDLEFKQAVHMYNGNYEKISDWSHLTSLVQDNIGKAGLHVWEITTTRDTNLREHRELWGRVSNNIGLWLKGEEE